MARLGLGLGLGLGSIYCVVDIGEVPREARPPIRFALNLPGLNLMQKSAN